MPTIIGKSGVESLIEIDVTDEEKAGLQNCARVLKETLAAVG